MDRHIDRPEAVNTLGRAATHLVALLVAPTMCALIPWFIEGHAESEPVTGSLSTATYLLMGSLPMAGAGLAVGYACWVGHPRYVSPLVPFIAVASANLICMITIAFSDRHDVDSATDAYFIAAVCWVIQPALAFVGGLIAIARSTGAPHPNQRAPREGGTPRYW